MATTPDDHTTSRRLHGRARRATFGLTGVLVVVVGVLGAPTPAWALRAMAISNQAGPGQPIGSPVYDSATLSAGKTPTGTITFQLYVPSDPTCAGTPAFTQAVTVAGGGFYRSANYVPSVPGTYRWTATYSGDARNAAVASSCSATGATVDVAKLRPALAVSATVSAKGGATTATASIRGANPTGTLVFKIYGPGNPSCAGTPVFTSDTAVAGNGSYPSAPFTATVGGRYQWALTYGGDGNNEPVSTACSDAAGAVNLMAGVTLTAGPAIVLPAGSVTATWSGIASPSPTDWVGLYLLGAPDSAVRAWRYTGGVASGSATVKVPWLTLPGIYEVRLFAANGYARLAPPALVTVV